jgi:sarcosine oxidase subunit beta
VETADAVIIGGGVIGVSMAFYLAQRRFGRILLLERDALGCGSTGRSVATIDLFTLQAAGVPLQARSHEVFRHFAEVVGEECGFQQTGFAILAGPEHEESLREVVAVAQSHGIEVRLLSPAECASIEPTADLKGVTLASYTPGAGHADPMLTTNAFAAAARRLGVVIQPGRPMTGLRRARDTVIGVDTAAGPIAAPVVALAAGPWNGRLLSKVGYDVCLQPVRHPVACLHRPPNYGPPHLNMIDLPNAIYARPETGDLTLVGSIDPRVGYDPCDPEDDHGRVSPEYALWVCERLVRRYPALEASDMRNGWSGLLTVSPDWQPILGPVPAVSGLYCAAGFSGQGFKISPAVGDLMGGLIADEPEAKQLLAPFRLGRFADSQPLRAKRKLGTWE